MNRNKTKDMMKDFFLPAFDDDFSDLIHENNNVRFNIFIHFFFNQHVYKKLRQTKPNH